MIERTAYRWTCPYCDVSRSSSGEIEADRIRTRAKNAVNGHVCTSAGDGHGSQYRVPEGFDPADHIEPIS